MPKRSKKTIEILSSVITGEGVASGGAGGGDAPEKHAVTPGEGERPPSPIRGDDDRRHVKDFFKAIQKDIFPEKDNKLSFIVVAHLVPTFPNFFDILKEIGTVNIVIPKSSVQVSNEYLHYPLLPDVIKLEKEKKRDWFSMKENVLEMIQKNVPKENKFLIIDIGGYFAKTLLEIKNTFQDRFLGIVEDTENGHQKYAGVVSISTNQTCPVISVARCKLKETEDYNVGKSIVEAADAILRRDAHTILERMKVIGVFGFGKIGHSIADHLRQKNVRTILVYDSNPLVQIKVSSFGFQAANRGELLKNCDMIFSATGQQALRGSDFLIEFVAQTPGEIPQKSSYWLFSTVFFTRATNSITLLRKKQLFCALYQLSSLFSI